VRRRYLDERVKVVGLYALFLRVFSRFPPGFS
jgi:hypothetical protein